MIKTSVNTGVLGCGLIRPLPGIIIAKDIYNKYSDLDAKAFLWTSGATNNRNREGVYYLCRELKMAGIYSKISVLYPFVGCDYTAGSSVAADSYLFNLINPRLFKCTVNGEATYRATGYTGNGTNGWLNTGFFPNNLPRNDAHISTYCRTAALGTLGGNEIGAGAGTTFSQIRIRNNSGNFQGNINGSTTLQIANSDARGFYVMQRTASNAQEAYKNGALFGSNAGLSNADLAMAIAIGATNTQISGTYSTRELCFASYGLSMTVNEIRDFNTIVQNFQAILNRAV